MRRGAALGLFALAALTSVALFAVPASGAPSTGTTKTYIVQTIQAPAVAYDGGIAGYAATRPAPGREIDRTADAVKRYTAYLNAQHGAVLAKVGGAERIYDYNISYNGFAAKLTEQQAAALKTTKGVVAVSENELRPVDTSSTPSFLGLDKAGGAWQKLGGVGSAGEGVVVGILDGGIWPEAPAFSDKVGNTVGYGMPAYTKLPWDKWKGFCTYGQEFDKGDCSNKIVGARWYIDGFGGAAATDPAINYYSPRDQGGHGSHTSSTAAGNANAVTSGVATGVGASTSGIAPRARIAVYKVCWEKVDPSTGIQGGSCSTADSVAAIDDAIADGVDVLNYSISGSRTNFLDPVEVAFLYAADAGVAVATSAGNEGPAASTVAHPSPWLTTVAASTHNRDGLGTLKVGATTYNGKSFAPTAATGTIVDAGPDSTQAGFCFLGALDPSVVTGKLVICDRGVNARTDKSLAVQLAGGIGMILVNTSANSVNADLHYVPTIHLQNTDRASVMGKVGQVGTIAKGTLVLNAAAPFQASFSSRGPLVAGGGDQLKPDITAPGQDILATVAPPGNHGRLQDLYSGTSMSSPHIAGVMALLTQGHPGWSPAAMRSAVMTTAYDTLDYSPFSAGAGHVDPTKALDPGLVYDAGFSDWFGFLCGTGQLVSSSCTSLRIDPSDLNQASIAIGDLAGSQTITRTVTNVGSQTETYSASVSGLTGIDKTLPVSFTLAPGESKTFQVGFTRTSAAIGSYATGFFTLTGNKGHVVRSPVVIRPVALAAPSQVVGQGTSGSTVIALKTGFAGSLTTATRGLVPATTFVSPIQTGQQVSFAFTVPAGTTLARIALFDDSVTPAGTDLDLIVLKGSTVVGSSGGGTTQEEVNLANPAAGSYTAVVDGFAVPGGSGAFKLFVWTVGSASAGNMTATPSPATATVGGTVNLTVGWSGLTAGVRYLGVLVFSDGSSTIGSTVVRIDTPGSAGTSAAAASGGTGVGALPALVPVALPAAAPAVMPTVPSPILLPQRGTR